MNDSIGIHGGLSWIHTQIALADLYRATGRSSDADRVEKALGTLLGVADPELPLRARLARNGAGIGLGDSRVRDD